MSCSVSMLQYYTISIIFLLFTKRGVAEHANNTCNAFCNKQRCPLFIMSLGRKCGRIFIHSE